ncbi:MAG: hypothetical protein WA154_12855 [Moraxellaceae bacterium]
MKHLNALATGVALAALLSGPLHAQTYDPGAVVSGVKPSAGQRHEAVISVIPKGGDYSRFDSDLDSSGNAQAHIRAVTLVDATGQPITSLGTPAITGYSTLAAQQAVQQVYGSVTANRSVLYDNTGAVLDYSTPAPNYPTPSGAAANALVPLVSASAAATSLVLKASAGNYFDGYCKSSAAGNCILYNATTVPSAGALTAGLVLECAPVAAGGVGGWTYSGVPSRGSTGLVMIFSSDASCNTYTASSTAYLHGRVQ